MYSQSPASTEVWLPQTTLIDGRPRRVLARSITSSCTSVAVWIISTTAAMRISMGFASPSMRPESSTRMGRRRLPPPACRY